MATIDEYKAARAANGEQRLKIMRVLDAAGLSGYREVEELADRGYALDKVWRNLSHEDRMAVLDEERAERDAILAKCDRRAAPPAQEAPVVDLMEALKESLRSAGSPLVKGCTE